VRRLAGQPLVSVDVDLGLHTMAKNHFAPSCHPSGRLWRLGGQRRWRLGYARVANRAGSGSPGSGVAADEGHAVGPLEPRAIADPARHDTDAGSRVEPLSLAAPTGIERMDPRWGTAPHRGVVLAQRGNELGPVEHQRQIGMPIGTVRRTTALPVWKNKLRFFFDRAPECRTSGIG
jgi:hypothetical protein